MSVTPLPAPALAPGRPTLVVTGFMGTGKSAAGAMAARRLGLPFLDLDAAIERRTGLPIAELFARHGEQAFRELERHALEDAARLSGAVVATGGGAVLHGEAFAALAAGSCVAVLTCRRDELLRRLDRRGDTPARPLLVSLADRATRVDELLRERREAYARAGTALDVTALSLDGVASELAARYRAIAPDAVPVRISADSSIGPSEVLVGQGLLERAGERLLAILPVTRSAVVVADGAVFESLGMAAAGGLREAGLEVRACLPVPAGEEAKSLATLGGLWQGFHDSGLEPDGVVVAVGGGATLDVAGLAAATYARGVPLVSVPTTLLAMVDAAVGGKVGIGHAGAKNLVGAFHPARLVLADSATLRTLPPRVVHAGLAEAVKAFVLASPLALDRLEARVGSGEPFDETELAWLIEQAIRIKVAYVVADPRDRGLRHALNLGHTFAHALESATGHAVSHGEAVSAGLVAAARLGEAEGVTAPGTAERLVPLLGGLGLPVGPPAGVDLANLVTAARADKKRTHGRAVFAVPAPGGAALVDHVPLEEGLARLFDSPDRALAAGVRP